MGVRKAILFGSAARGEVLEGSDIDLILVRDTAERYLDRVDEDGCWLPPEAFGPDEATRAMQVARGILDFVLDRLGPHRK